MQPPAIVVFAKTPSPGRVKTRLCPPLSPSQASQLYAAFLSDTLLQIAHSCYARRVIAYAGEPEWFAPWRSHFALLPQTGADLGERLLAACQSVGGPLVCVGSDSPHLSSAIYKEAYMRLQDHDVVLGPATDGGYYLIGLRQSVDLFTGMPMSTERLYGETRRRAATLGLRVSELAVETDLDTWADVQATAGRLPEHSRRVLVALMRNLGETSPGG